MGQCVANTTQIRRCKNPSQKKKAYCRVHRDLDKKRIGPLIGKGYGGQVFVYDVDKVKVINSSMST